MKTYDEAISFDCLYESMMKCKRGVMWKTSVSSFVNDATKNIMKLEEELKSGTYKSMKPRIFQVTTPKPRNILATSFRDRVYQRSLNDNIIYEAMTKSFILDNCACQKGKGTDFARNRLKEHLHRFYRKNGYEGYFLQIDIKKYYDNLRHSYVEGLFKEKLDEKTYNAVIEILHSQYPGDKGYNPGSQLIQIAGISSLDYLDHFIKEQCKIKHYVRYMDDLILLHENKAVLELVLDLIKDKLSEIGLEVNSKKTHIQKLKYKIPFLGFNFILLKTGKVIMKVKSESIDREKRHLRGMLKRANNNKMSFHDIDECFKNWINCLKVKKYHYTATKNMIKYYKGEKIKWLKLYYKKD